MRRGAVVMPGSTLGEGTLLRESALLLKGEATGKGEVWVGNPAVDAGREGATAQTARGEEPAVTTVKAIESTPLMMTGMGV